MIRAGLPAFLWAGVIFGIGSPSWGAFPGNGPQAIESGCGTVHNSLLFDHPERTVAYAPFVIGYPKPPWFADHRNLRAVGRKVTQLEAAPSLSGLAGLGLSALRG